MQPPQIQKGGEHHWLPSWLSIRWALFKTAATPGLGSHGIESFHLPWRLSLNGAIAGTPITAES